MFGKFLADLDDCREFTRGQSYGPAPVARQSCDLAKPFCFRFGFGLEKLPASIKRTEIEIPGMRFTVASEYALEAENVDTKSTIGLWVAFTNAILIDKRLGSSVGRAVD